jgi:GntR family transcriptional regulator
MIFQVNFKSGLPVYLQVVDQVKAAAAAGTLQPGEPLPSIRPLAEELRVNRNTIAKAYTELETQGVIETIPGKGCFIKENNSPLKKEVRRKLLVQDIDAVVVQAHHLQVPREEFLRLVSDRLDALAAKQRSNQALKNPEARIYDADPSH